MFDIGFSELLVIALVALVVIGPERLPKVARTIGLFMGRARRYMDDVKTDIQREVELSELRQLRDELSKEVKDIEKSVNATVAELKDEWQQSAAGASLNEAKSHIDVLKQSLAKQREQETTINQSDVDHDANKPS